MKARTHLRVVDAGGESVREKKILAAEDERLYREMVESYRIMRLGSRSHTKKAVASDIATVESLVTLSGKPPWRWTEEDFERWCYEIGVVKKCAKSTQRKYQSAIRTFLGYLIRNVTYQARIRERYGVSIVQICNEENCIPHVLEREHAKARPAFEHAQIDALFDGFDAAIREAARFGTKSLCPLQRDKVIFHLMYHCGLRDMEVLGLDMTSFLPNEEVPEFGEFGFLSVWGKGSNGSGPKHRLVPVVDPEVPKMLRWYIDEVRPHFAKKADANETAVFLSQLGTRLSVSSLIVRFHAAIERADLVGRGFVPHCLRHSSVTHKSFHLSLEAIRQDVGHVLPSTTQGYMKVSDEFIRDEISDTAAKWIHKGEEERND